VVNLQRDGPATKQVTILKTATLVAAAAASSVGWIGWSVLSTADAWDSSHRVTKFLKGLKNREADREGIPFALLDVFFHYHWLLIHVCVIL
jgi:hypothetical protein